MYHISKARIFSPLFTFLLFASFSTPSLYAQSAPLEPEITHAFIKDAKVYVIGKDAIPGESVYWRTHHRIFHTDLPVVGTVDEAGNFRFVSEDLPALPRCFAEVIIGDLEQETTIHVDNCEGTITGFYTTYLQDDEGEPIRTSVMPGERGYAGAQCNPGDFAVSGGHNIHAESTIVPNSAVLSSGLGIRDHIQGWGVEIGNHGATEITFGVGVTCAKVEPPASRTRPKKSI